MLGQPCRAQQSHDDDGHPRKALQEAGFDYDSADQVMQPKNEVELSLEDARKVSKLIDNLDDLDDVQNIYSNWTASDEVMAQLDEE